MLPTEGLIPTCLVLGKDRSAAEYERGVANLLRTAWTCKAKQGEFNEGIGYAMFTVQLDAGRSPFLAAQGDTRTSSGTSFPSRLPDLGRPPLAARPLSSQLL